MKGLTKQEVLLTVQKQLKDLFDYLHTYDYEEKFELNQEDPDQPRRLKRILKNKQNIFNTLEGLGYDNSLKDVITVLLRTNFEYLSSPYQDRDYSINQWYIANHLKQLIQKELEGKNGK